MENCLRVWGALFLFEKLSGNVGRSVFVQKYENYSFARLSFNKFFYINESIMYVCLPKVSNVHRSADIRFFESLRVVTIMSDFGYTLRP